MNNKTSLTMLSRYRNEIYGFAALWVMLSHIADYRVFDFSKLGIFESVVRKACSYGNVGVDIFLFLSGISLYFSWTKGNHNLADFYKKRICRIIPSYLIIVIPIALFQYFTQIGDYPRGLFIDISTFRIWIDGSRYIPWYVSAILMFYAIYPIIHTFIYGYEEKYKNIRYILLMILCYYFIRAMHLYNPDYYNKIYIIISRLPVFITGCFLGEFVKKKKSFLNIIWLPIWIIFVGHIYLRPYVSDWKYYIQFIMPSIPMTFILAAVFSGLNKKKNKLFSNINKFFLLTGEISFELYLTHVLFYRLTVPNSYYERSRYFWLLGMIMSYIFALIVRAVIVKKLYKKIFKKKKISKVVLKN